MRVHSRFTQYDASFIQCIQCIQWSLDAILTIIVANMLLAFGTRCLMMHLTRVRVKMISVLFYSKFD